jgi:hypothetical protein
MASLVKPPEDRTNNPNLLKSAGICGRERSIITVICSSRVNFLCVENLLMHLVTILPLSHLTRSSISTTESLRQHVSSSSNATNSLPTRNRLCHCAKAVQSPITPQILASTRELQGNRVIATANFHAGVPCLLLCQGDRDDTFSRFAIPASICLDRFDN